MTVGYILLMLFSNIKATFFYFYDIYFLKIQEHSLINSIVMISTYPPGHFLLNIFFITLILILHLPLFKHSKENDTK